MIQPQTRREEQLQHEDELRRVAEGARREGTIGPTRSGRVLAGALRAMSATLTRTADALDTPCERLERDTRMVDRA